MQKHTLFLYRYIFIQYYKFLSILTIITKCILTCKGEIRNRFDLISEERVTFFKHNSENLMKISWKIRKLWHFEVSQIFTKHFLTSRYEYANEWVDDVITSLLAIYFVHKILKILKFLPKLVIVCPSYQDLLELTLFCIYSGGIKASLTFS